MSDPELAQKLRMLSKDARHAWLSGTINRLVAEQVRAMRRHRHWSQKELARRAGLHQPQIARIENGHLGSVKTLRRIASAFDVALVIRFATWGECIEWVIAAPYLPPPVSGAP